MSDEEQLFDFKKRPKPKAKPKEAAPKAATSAEVAEQSGFKDPNKYETMLERLVKILKNQNLNTTKTPKLSFPPIQLENVGLKKNKKYIWKNFGEFAKQLNRPVDHMRDFVARELSIDPIIIEDLVLKMESRKIETEDLQTILIKYIHEFVKCPLCHSPKTTMVKDASLRVFVINCENCKASRSLVQIKTNKK
jgi:translation initiation factor 2 subunit 2